MDATPNKAKPFLKWCGSKRALVPELLKRIPKSWDKEKRPYYEPFVGGGALFFALQPKYAHLSDINEELITTYTAIRDDVGSVIGTLSAMTNTPEEFARIRALDPEDFVNAADVAARMIYLNKCCFNGLFRVNKAGKFNSPYGYYENPTICDEENLRACSKALQDADITCADFSGGSVCNEQIVDEPALGDFTNCLLYFDPPFVPVSKTANFTSYSAGGFPYREQLRLASFAAEIRDRGGHVVLSQAADKSLGEQYKRLGFKVDLVKARRNVNCNGDKRGPVGEYIIW